MYFFPSCEGIERSFLCFQSFLAQKSLNVQLERVGILAHTECFSTFPDDYGKFRTCMEPYP